LRELDREVALQFHEDGSNFEASTCYHRLSAELIVYTAALALNLPPDKQNRFPLAHRERIEKMGEFTQHITKPSGRVPQIGDNDSGRFLKLFPAYERLTVEEACARYANLDGYESDDQEYWDEDVLDHGHLLAAMNGLFGRADWPSGPEATLVRGLAGGRQLPSYRRDGMRSAAEQVRIGADWAEQRARVRRLPFHYRQEIPVGPPTSDPLQTYVYRDFGLYVFRLERVYLAVRCGSVGKLGSHAHNDQLAVELALDGEDWIVDPGTYLYTALPDRRNEYRSVRAHFAPQIAEGEPGRLDIDLFRLSGEARAECLYFGPEGFIGVHYGYGSPVYRMVTLEADQIVIEDAAEQPLIPIGHGELPISLKYGSRNR
ncbi:MAG TPA: heparinase II/III family protein, partial [Aggregatilineaceae bacterium]|nr:heparinase II/III family protein [Aggregatilineaceae bacterium]